MFDTMTLTKTVGSLCGALLVFMMANWAAESIYSMGGGHGDEHHSAGYVVDTGGDDHGGEEAAEAGPDFAELFMAADTAKGERVFNKCKACHALEDGVNGAGPTLYGVVGRDVDSVAGFGYSGSLSAVADVWTPENLNAFLEKPATYAPGTTMGFSGLGKIEDRAHLIAYLDQTDGTTYEMDVPADEEASAAEAVEQAVEEVADAAEEAVEDATQEVAEAAGAATEAAQEAAEEAVAEVEQAAEEVAEDAGFAALVASADVEAGAKVYRGCKACHALEAGKNGVGPSLHGVVGRDIAGVEGYNYSDALKAIEGDWTPEQLSAWLLGTQEFAPGNKMRYRAIKDEADRANVIAYIESQSK